MTMEKKAGELLADTSAGSKRTQRPERKPVANVVAEQAAIVLFGDEVVEMDPLGEGALDLFIREPEVGLVTTVARDPSKTQRALTDEQDHPATVADAIRSFEEVHTGPAGDQAFERAGAFVPGEYVLGRYVQTALCCELRHGLFQDGCR